MNRNTANRYYNLLRRAILSESIREAGLEVGEYELDESYFGARCGRVAAMIMPRLKMCFPCAKAEPAEFSRMILERNKAAYKELAK